MKNNFEPGFHRVLRFCNSSEPQRNEISSSTNIMSTMTTDTRDNNDLSIPCPIPILIPIPRSITTTAMVDGIDLPDEQLDFCSSALWQRLQAEALEALDDEPELSLLLQRTILAPGVSSFEEAVAMTVCYRLLQTPCAPQTSKSSTLTPQPVFCPNSLFEIFRQALMNPEHLELDHTMSYSVRQDVMAVIDRDPACDTILEVVLFMKGFAALVCHRAARQKWMQSLTRGKNRSLTALFLQSQASAVFGMDIHPAASIGAGILLDHGTGVVIGETAHVGDGCTMLHAVTLGGTGKDHGDRHPKIGARVFIGAGAKILGNIHVGDGAKIGAGSIVLKSIPAGATAVGAPAKIIGRALEQDPARDRDENLDHVGMLHKSSSAATVNTTLSSSEGSTNNLDHGTYENNWKYSLDKLEESDEAVPARKAVQQHQHEQEDDDLHPPGCFCPFRDYVHMSLTAPKGTITIVSLQKVLLPEGCTSNEIGCTFFDLDLRNVGYVHWKDAQNTLKGCLSNNTRLTEDRIKAILEHLEKKHHQET